jgi:hypothetical protein
MAQRVMNMQMIPLEAKRHASKMKKIRETF